MEEYDESSDIEMVPVEEIHIEERPSDPIKSIVKAESQVLKMILIVTIIT